MYYMSWITIIQLVTKNEQLPSHRHRNLKAFEEHIQTHISSCFITEWYLYNFSGLVARVVWKLFIQRALRGQDRTRHSGIWDSVQVLYMATTTLSNFSTWQRHCLMSLHCNDWLSFSFDSEESVWSGWNALQSALETGGPWLQGAYSRDCKVFLIIFLFRRFFCKVLFKLQGFLSSLLLIARFSYIIRLARIEPQTSASESRRPTQRFETLTLKLWTSYIYIYIYTHTYISI